MDINAINQTIAEKVMGYIPVKDAGVIISYIDGNREINFCDHEDSENQWNPAERMDDAMAVVEKLSYGKSDFSFKLELFYKGYFATFSEDISTGEVIKYESDIQETAPLAICIAALEAIGEIKN